MADRPTETDLELFERIAKSYSAKDLYPPSRRARIQRLEQTISPLHLSSNSRLLEVGCGAGYAATYLRGRYATFLGLDYSENLIAYARQANSGPGVTFVAADILDYTPQDRCDALFMIGVLHHVADPESAVARLAHWVQPGGWLVANEPQPGNPAVAWARGVRKSTDADYSEEQLQLQAGTIERWYRSAGLVDVRHWWQGVISTPFAEVRIGPTWLTNVGVSIACDIDQILERYGQRFLARVSWNVVVAGRRPA